MIGFDVNYSVIIFVLFLEPPEKQDACTSMERYFLYLPHFF